MAEGRQPQTSGGDDGRENDAERSRARHRLEIVEALIRSIDLGCPLIEAIRDSADRAEAVQRLQLPPFQFSEMAAHHVLDLPPSRQTRTGRQVLVDERHELEALLRGPR